MAQCCSECQKKDLIIKKGHAMILGLTEEIKYQAEKTRKILVQLETIERKLIEMDAMSVQQSQYNLKKRDPPQELESPSKRRKTQNGCIVPDDDEHFDLEQVKRRWIDLND